MIRQAVISAGGFGTRLRPHTDTMPKPMIPILGRPLLEWHIEQFKKFGVMEFFFTLHYLPQVVMDYFGDGSKFGVRIHYFMESEPLGSAGALKKFEMQLEDDFFYIYGDIFSLMHYETMEAVWRQKPSGAIGMQRVERSDDYVDADIAELDAKGRFIAIHAKPHSVGAKYPNAYRMRGAHIFNKKITSYIPDVVASDLAKQVLSAALAAGENFYGYECDDYSKGIDTIEKWKEVEVYLKTLRKGE